MDVLGIVDVCEALGLKYNRPRETVRGPQISISCPLAPWTHTDPADKNAGCSVSINDEGPSVVLCFGGSCGFSGSFYELILRAVNKRVPPPPELLEVVKRIAEAERIDLEGIFHRASSVIDGMDNNLGVPIPGQVVTGITMRILSFGRDAERDILEEVTLDQFDNSVPQYVLDRGIKQETAKKWGLRYDRRLYRVVFPVRRMDGQLIGMTGRIVPSHDKPDANGNEPTKYHNYTGLNKVRYLYGANFFKTGQPIVVCEGPFDVLKTDQALAGRAAVCASLGHGFSNNHRLTIATAQPSRVLVFTDDDLAGRVSAEKIVAQLDATAPVFLMTAKGGKDPGAMTDQAILEAFERAKPLLTKSVEIDWVKVDEDPLSAPGYWDKKAQEASNRPE